MNTEIEQILNDLESEIQAISVESHTGGYEDRENAIETLNKLKLKLFTIPKYVSSSAKYTAETIQALNNTLLANKAIGNYAHIEKECIEKLEILINKIK